MIHSEKPGKDGHRDLEQNGGKGREVRYRRWGGAWVLGSGTGDGAGHGACHLWLTVADEASGSSSGTCLAAPPSSKQSRPCLPLELGKHQEVSQDSECWQWGLSHTTGCSCG